MSNIQGSCLCGSVKYRLNSEALLTLICHCIDCQKQSGSAFSTNVIFPADALEIEGDVSSFESKGDIGAVSGSVTTRNFCSKCGSALFTNLTAHPEFTIIKAGTLDSKIDLRPSAQIYCDRTQNWLELNVERRYPRHASAEELFS